MSGDNKPFKVNSPLTEKKHPIRLFADRFTAPAVGIQDAPNRCYRLNNEWAKIVMGFCSLLTETRGWNGAFDESHPGIQGVMGFLVGEDCGLINCDDIEACLQTSETLTAIIGVTYNVQLSNTQEHFDELNLAYDGTAQSIGASIPTTAPNLNSLHDNALCSVLNNIIRVYSFSKGASLVLLGNFGTWYQNTLAAMRGIAGIVPNYLWYLLGDELYGCAPDVATATAALGDTDAIEEFACCLREELRGVAMSQAVFDAAIATCVGSLTGNAGIIACLFDGDNSLEHYLSFLEAYNFVLERQIDGEDFVCVCVPSGWFWLDVDWNWEAAVHSGSAFSPIFSHTNPNNGELFSITAMHRSNLPLKSRLRFANTGLPDTLIGTPVLGVSQGLHLWEDAVVGVMDGANAVGWPSGWRTDQGMNGSLRLPSATFSVQWKHEVNLGATRSVQVSRVRLLYKEVP